MALLVEVRQPEDPEVAVLASLYCDECFRPARTVVVTGSPAARRGSITCDECNATKTVSLTDAQSAWLWKHERGPVFVHFSEESR